MNNTIKMFWWSEEPNFGDAMNPLLVERLFSKNVAWAKLEEAQLIGAGSLLQWVPTVENVLKQPLHVWGSGYMLNTRAAISSPNIIHHAVRGKKSKNYGKLDDSVAVGDPGLLVSRVIDAKPKKYTVGIVPHLWHLDDPLINMYDWHIIDVRLDPEEVIKQITECEFIFSSSLHGLVIADSYGIPNQWVKFEKPLFGGDWKFEDYYSVFNIDIPSAIALEASTSIDSITSSVSATYSRPELIHIQDTLIRSFPDFQ